VIKLLNKNSNHSDGTIRTKKKSNEEIVKNVNDITAGKRRNVYTINKDININFFGCTGSGVRPTVRDIGIAYRTLVGSMSELILGAAV